MANGMMLRGAGFLVVAAAALWWAADVEAQVPYRTISSAGPLDRIDLGNDLSCQVHHVADATNLQFYPPATRPGDCGWFMYVGPQPSGVFFAPDMANHGGSAAGSIGTYTAFTPVSQSPVTGAGTPSNPYSVVTTVSTGSMTLVSNDTYVVGQDYYTSWLGVRAPTSGPAWPVRLWRAGDCYLGSSDFGYGAVGITAPGSIACTRQPNNVPADRFEEFIPLSPGSRHYHEFYDTVWSWIGARNTFPNTCQCTSYLDNGAGLSWDFIVQPTGQWYWFGARLRFAVDATPIANFAATPDPCPSYWMRFDDVSSPGQASGFRSSTWDWGDGTPPQTFAPWQARVSHRYASPGTYSVTLEVETTENLRARVTLPVVVVRCEALPVADLQCGPAPPPQYYRILIDSLVSDPDNVVVDTWWTINGQGPIRPGPTTWDSPSGAPVTVQVGVRDVHGVIVLSPVRTCLPRPNAPPVLADIPDQRVMEGRELVVTSRATDPEGDPLDYVVTAGLPPGAAWSEDHGVMHWRAPPLPAGPYTVSVQAIEEWRPGRDTTVAPLLRSNVVTFQIFVGPQPLPEDSPPDADRDGLPDGVDNCPLHANADQRDGDGDRRGDLCEEHGAGGGVERPPAPPADHDGDGVIDRHDVCPHVHDPPQRDTDRDGLGDACDPDANGDGRPEQDALGRTVPTCVGCEGPTGTSTPDDPSRPAGVVEPPSRAASRAGGPAPPDSDAASAEARARWAVPLAAGLGALALAAGLILWIVRR